MVYYDLFHGLLETFHWLVYFSIQRFGAYPIIAVCASSCWQHWSSRSGYCSGNTGHQVVWPRKFMKNILRHHVSRQPVNESELISCKYAMLDGHNRYTKLRSCQLAKKWHIDRSVHCGLGHVTTNQMAASWTLSHRCLSFPIPAYLAPVCDF